MLPPPSVATPVAARAARATSSDRVSAAPAAGSEAPTEIARRTRGLRRGPQPDQVRPAVEPLAQLPVRERGHPYRGHQVTPAQLGQHPRVDLVGLARQRSDRLHLARVRHLHLPARGSQPTRTHTAPLIISTQALTSEPSAIASFARPSSSASVTPSATI